MLTTPGSCLGGLLHIDSEEVAMAALHASPTGIQGAAPGVDLAAAFQLAPIGLAVLDHDLRYVHCNEHLAEINGCPVEYHIGRRFDDLRPQLAAVLGPVYQEVFKTGEPVRDFEAHGPTPGATGADRTWLASVAPLKDHTGRVQHILVSVKEITEIEQTRAEVRRSEESFRIAQQLGTSCFTISKAIRNEAGEIVDFLWEYANPAADAKSPSGPLTGRRLLEVFPSNGTNPLLMDRYVQRIREGGSDEVEIRFDTGGVSRWYSDACVPIGHDRIAISYRDITERKKLEEELRIVGMEFRHRLKNVFAVVAALVKQSARTASDIDSLAEDLRSRIFALSAAQGLLHSGADHCSLSELTADILEPFAGPRLVLEPGPAILLRHDGLVALALALNELATNAIKFGALSNDTGRVTVGWTIGDGRACLTWREEGGPTVRAPDHCGLGTRLIDDAGKRLPGGKVAVEFAPTGLVAKICLDVPAEADLKSST